MESITEGIKRSSTR